MLLPLAFSLYCFLKSIIIYQVYHMHSSLLHVEHNKLLTFGFSAGNVYPTEDTRTGRSDNDTPISGSQIGSPDGGGGIDAKSLAQTTQSSINTIKPGTILLYRSSSFLVFLFWRVSAASYYYIFSHFSFLTRVSSFPFDRQQRYRWTLW